MTHPADERTGFDWLSYVPRSLSSGDTVYIAIHGFQCCHTQAEEVKYNSDAVLSLLSHAEQGRVVLLSPAIPGRVTSDPNVEERVFHFPHDVFTSQPDFPFNRLDLKVGAMIDELANMLSKDGYSVHPKVFVFGFSIGGMFTMRYSALNPGRVQAFASGAPCGAFTIPVSEIEGVELNWPLGVGDFESLVGEPFQADLYKSIPQFYFWGGEDNVYNNLAENPDWSHWRNYWGRDTVTESRKQCSFLQSLGMQVECKEYSGAAHLFTVQMQRDVFAFFDAHRD